MPFGGMPPDIGYFSGPAVPADPSGMKLAQLGIDMVKAPQQQAAKKPPDPEFVAQIQQRYGVDYNTAMQMAQMADELQQRQRAPAQQPMQQLADGGILGAGEPALVGEQGPEMFVPMPRPDPRFGAAPTPQDLYGSMAPPAPSVSMLPVPTQAQLRALLHPPIGAPSGTNWAPDFDYANFKTLPYPYQKATAEAEDFLPYQELLRIKPKEWEDFLRETPRSKHIEHRKKGD